MLVSVPTLSTATLNIVCSLFLSIIVLKPDFRRLSSWSVPREHGTRPPEIQHFVPTDDRSPTKELAEKSSPDITVAARPGNRVAAWRGTTSADWWGTMFAAWRGAAFPIRSECHAWGPIGMSRSRVDRKSRSVRSDCPLHRSTYHSSGPLPETGTAAEPRRPSPWESPGDEMGIVGCLFRPCRRRPPEFARRCRPGSRRPSCSRGRTAGVLLRGR